MPTPFEPLRERLLRAGVARRHASRYVAELQDHLDDLIAEESLAPDTQGTARSRALARLGTPQALADAMISRRELSAWSAKAPVTTYVVAPSIALVLGAAVTLAMLVLTFTLVRGASGVSSGLPVWSKPLAGGVAFFCNTVLCVLLGWVLGLIAIRQRSPWLWPVLGIVLLAALSAAVQVGVTPPSGTRPGEIELSSGFGPSLPYWTECVGRFALDLALTLAPCAGVALWRERSTKLARDYSA